MRRFDAVLIAAPLEEIELEVLQMEDAMREASRFVLAGFELGTDAKITHYPDRYYDNRGEKMWARVMGLIGEGEQVVCSLQETARLTERKPRTRRHTRLASSSGRPVGGVCFWHSLDIPPELTNVRYWG